jgi:quinol monooxygenase YgiN
MSNIIHFAARFPKIEEHNLGKFKEHATVMLDRAKSEPGLLHYDFFFNPDESVCVVLETYADSAAVLDHMTGMSDLLPLAMELGGGFEAELFGNPSPALAEALASFGLPTYAFFQGK